MADRLERIRKLIASDRLPEALRECDKILRREPANLEATIQKAWILASPIPEVHDPEKAVSLLEHEIEKHPASGPLHAALAYAYDTGLGDYELAAHEYRTAIDLQPDDESSYLQFALLLKAPGSGVSLEEAKEYLERGVQNLSSAWQLWRELALLSWEGGDLSHAKEQFEAAVACETEISEYSRKQMDVWLQRVRAGMSFEKGFCDREI